MKKGGAIEYQRKEINVILPKLSSRKVLIKKVGATKGRSCDVKKKL